MLHPITFCVVKFFVFITKFMYIFPLDVESIMDFFFIFKKKGRKGLGTVLLLYCLCGGFKKSESQLTVSDGVKQKNISFKIVELVQFDAYSTYLVSLFI